MHVLTGILGPQSLASSVEQYVIENGTRLPECSSTQRQLTECMTGRRYHGYYGTEVKRILDYLTHYRKLQYLVRT